MGLAKRYRRSANECLALAGTASDPDDRAFLISMAADLCNLADAPPDLSRLPTPDYGTATPASAGRAAIFKISDYRKRPRASRD